MDLFKYVPTCTKGKDATVKGHLMLEVPTMTEQAEGLEQARFTYTESGEMDVRPTSAYGPTARLGEYACGFVREIELTKKNGFKVPDVDHLKRDKDCRPILVELAGLMMEGVSLGEQPKP